MTSSSRSMGCRRKGSWSLMSGHTTWEPQPSYLWAWLRWFWGPHTNPHPDPEIQAELEEHRVLYDRWHAHQRNASRHLKKAEEHQVNALVHSAKLLAHNEYDRALALAARRRGQDVPVPPSLVGRIHEKD